LFSTEGVELNGIILISVALSFQTIASEEGTRVFHPGNELPFPLHLPTYAATAWYHGRLSEIHQNRPLRELLDEVESLLRRYWTALAHGTDSSGAGSGSGKLVNYRAVETYLDRPTCHPHQSLQELLRIGQNVGRRLLHEDRPL
jgi:hypothetical protein